MGIVRWFVGVLIRLWVVFIVGSLVWAWRLRSEVTEAAEPDADEVDLLGVFGGRELVSTATAFRGGRLTAAYGGGLLDLRGATLDPAGARLELRSVFGGFQVVVPSTWRVDLQVVGIAGGAGDARDLDEVSADGPMLTIEGFAVFGGAGVVSARRDAAAAAEVLASL